MDGADVVILIPDLPEIERRASSQAERSVARLLREVDLGTDAVAFHSVNLRKHQRKQQAEADFVILVKGVVIVVEVKGGGVKKHNGIWYSIDRRNDWHRLNESPMLQAQGAAYALRDILQEDRVGWFPHEAIVITSDAPPPPHSPEWKSTHWLSASDMSIDGLSNALRTVISSARTAPAGIKIARQQDLRERLFGEFTCVPVIDPQRGAVVEEQNRATQGQARVLSQLAKNPRMLVTGGAGTGKSLVLVEAAKQEFEQGHSVLITFHSPSLMRFFEPYIAGRDIDLVPFEKLDPGKRYDVVLVDEAQDLMTADDMDRIESVIHGGRSAGRWRMFLDPNNQAHVSGDFDPDVLSIVESEAISLDLDLNVRNTRAIVHVVQEYLGADVGQPGIVAGGRVRWVNVKSPANVAAAESIARQMVQDNIAKEDIWIIDVSSEDEPRQTEQGFTVTSPRHTKGLETEYVIACNLPDAYTDASISALYVAVTRPRVALIVALSNTDRRQLIGLAKTLERA